MTIRIAYVISSVEGGGAALPVPSVTGVLRRAGAEVKVFALGRRDGRALPSFEAAGLDVVVRDGGRDDHLAACRWLDRQMRDWRPTHMWTSLTRATLLGQLVGLRRRIPVVSWQHAAFLKPANLRLLRITHRLSRLWVCDSDAVVTFATNRIGIDPRRLQKWPIFRADPDAPSAAPWAPGQPVRIGTLGRLHRVKGYDVLIEALGRLSSQGIAYEMAIGGDGALREPLEAGAEAAGAQVHFVGYVDDSRRFLSDLHLYVQPSRSEGLCVAAHEAMQGGLPVIASAVGELQHSIVDGLTGRTVPPGDPEALAAAIGNLLAHPERLHDMGQAARARVLDRFGPERFEANGLAVLDRLRAL